MNRILDRSQWDITWGDRLELEDYNNNIENTTVWKYYFRTTDNNIAQSYSKEGTFIKQRFFDMNKVNKHLCAKQT